MKLGDFETLFPHVDTEQCAFVNPLDALESHFFSRKAPDLDKLPSLVTLPAGTDTAMWGYRRRCKKRRP